MQHTKSAFYFFFVGLALVLGAGLFLALATPVQAQCGSQASSCKNCHEVQGQDPVNADGSSWHQAHAFGDFCYICHAGNNQAKDKDAAHEGLVAPLSDIKAACQQCHVADLEARAQVYADALGVTIGSGVSQPAAAESGTAPASAGPSSGALSNQCNELIVDDPNTIDYAQHYEQVVLGRQPVNWGNLILIGMIGLVAVGGGGYVITREKLINVKFGDTRKVEAEYPAEVVEMLPKIAALKSGTRQALRNVLESKKAGQALDLLDLLIKKDED